MTTGGPRHPAEGLTVQSAADVRVVAKGGAVPISGQIAQRGLAFLFVAIAVRLMGAAGYGLYRQVYQVLAIAGQVGLAGFNYAAMRFIARARASGDVGGVRGAAWMGVSGAMVASTAVAIALVVGADAIAARFAAGPGASEMARLLHIGAAFVPLFALTQVLRYCTQAYKTMVPSVIVGNIIQPAARFFFGVVLLAAGFAIAGMVVSLALAAALAAAAGYVSYRRMLSPAERVAAPVARPGPMTRFALLQAGASVFGVQTLGLGVLILGMLKGDREVGLFGIALALQGPGGVFLSGIVNIWAPVVTDLYERGEIDRLESLYQTITRWVVTFSLPVFAALIVEPEVFVRLFAGKAGESAAAVVVALALGNIFYTGTGPTGFVLSMTGRPGINFANSVVAVGLYMGLGLVVVPRRGAVGMAGVDALVTTLVNAARVLEAKVLVGIQPFGRSLLKPISATLAASGALLAWRFVADGGMPLRVTGLLIAGVVYLVVLRALGLDPEERHVWQGIRSRMTRMSRKERGDEEGVAGGEDAS